MSFVVTARKYRPQNFEELIGQEHISKSLKNSIQNKRIAQAYLFSGPRGTGKTSSARILAKALNCKEGPTPEPCGICDNCVEITNGTSLDVHEIDGASHRGVEQVRDLRDGIKYSPTNSKYKIYIIDEVHMLTDAAFNALLKTLEEPPPHVVFILATTELHKVKITIRSRCQCYTFKRLTVLDIVEQLKKICKVENISYDEDSLMYIAQHSDGCMRDSQSFLDQVIAFSGELIKVEDVKKVLGLIDYKIFVNFIKNIHEKNVSELFSIIHLLWEQGIDLNDFTRGIVKTFRDLLILKALGDSGDKINPILELTLEDKNYLVSIKDLFSNQQILKITDILINLNKEIKTSINSQHLFESTILKVLNYDKIIDLKELLIRLEKLENSILNRTPEFNIEVAKQEKYVLHEQITDEPDTKLDSEHASLPKSTVIKEFKPTQDVKAKKSKKTSEQTVLDEDKPQINAEEASTSDVNITELLQKIIKQLDAKYKVLSSLLKDKIKNIKIEDNNIIFLFEDKNVISFIDKNSENYKALSNVVSNVLQKEYKVVCQIIDKKQKSIDAHIVGAEELILELFEGEMVE